MAITREFPISTSSVKLCFPVLRSLSKVAALDHAPRPRKPLLVTRLAQPTRDADWMAARHTRAGENAGLADVSGITTVLRRWGRMRTRGETIPGAAWDRRPKN